MILNAHVPCHLAKFGDQVRYYWNGSQQVDLVWNFAPLPGGDIEVLTGRRTIKPEQVLEILRPVSVSPGDVWVTECGQRVRILETAAPGLNPIVGLLIYEHTSRVRQFSACGMSCNSNLMLWCPEEFCAPTAPEEELEEEIEDDT